jgi:hypothetical protein
MLTATCAPTYSPPPQLTTIDRELLHGPLGQAGGVTVFADLPDHATLAAMAAEATQAYSAGTRQDNDVSDGADGRGGVPPRSLTSGAGGPVQDALYASPQLHRFLEALCGVAMLPSGNRGSYSYYVQEGDFLDVHLDIPTCDLTLITVLDDKASPDDAGGALEAFPSDIGVPLSSVRERGCTGGHIVKAPPGHTVAILGGLVPHRVLPLAPSSQRVISALCFQAIA